MSLNIAIIVAAGKGTRSGSAAPKQFVPLGTKPVLMWSVDRFCKHDRINEVIVVAPADLREETCAMLKEYPGVRVVVGGKERADSVRNALAEIEDYSSGKVLIHDAARPGLSAQMIDELLAALDHYGACAPALPIPDALKRQEGDQLTSVDRSQLFRVQTPQAFQLHAIREAHARLAGRDLVDDLEAAQALGLQVHLIPGDPRLIKITYPEDFEMAERLLVSPSAPRMGTGFDVHAFEEGYELQLCGVAIAHDMRLEGHSDADVAWHALTDAILGALALGDIGDHFPPSDPQWRGAASEIFLAHAVRLAHEHGYKIGNVDVTIICEAPKVKPHREAMRQQTSQVLGVGVDCVSVKATTTESLGFTGRREGIAAQASAVLLPQTTHSQQD